MTHSICSVDYNAAVVITKNVTRKDICYNSDCLKEELYDDCLESTCPLSCGDFEGLNASNITIIDETKCQLTALTSKMNSDCSPIGSTVS